MFSELITDLLQQGYKVSFRAPGHSMFPTIMANETIVVEPIDPATVRLGDIILYRTNGRIIAHRVVGINVHPDDRPSTHSDLAAQSSVLSPHCLFILRGDASAACDAPVKAGQILGKIVSIERNGCFIEPYGFTYKIGCLATFWGGRIKRLPHRILSIFSDNGR